MTNFKVYVIIDDIIIRKVVRDVAKKTVKVCGLFGARKVSMKKAWGRAKKLEEQGKYYKFGDLFNQEYQPIKQGLDKGQCVEVEIETE